MNHTSNKRYHALQVTLHWLVVLLVIAAFVIGKSMSGQPNDAAKLTPLALHMSVGSITLLVIVYRFVMRQRLPKPEHVTAGNPFFDWVGKAVHYVLYLLVFLMAVSAVSLSIQAGLAPIVFGGSGALPVDFFDFTARLLYLRKILAEAHSITDEWDWAVSPRIDNVMKTVTALSTDSLYGPTIQTYNSIAQEYFTKTKSYEQSSGVQEDLILFTSRLGGNLVLDAGAGSCRDTVYLMQQGFKVEAIDLAEKLLRASADFCPNHVKRVMDIRLLAYANNTFDGIWCSAVLLHLDPANVEVSLKEFYRVLKPNGILHLSVKQGAGTQNVVADGLSNMYREFYYYTIEDVRNLVTKMKLRSMVLM